MARTLEKERKYRKNQRDKWKAEQRYKVLRYARRCKRCKTKNFFWNYKQDCCFACVIEAGKQQN